jgi:hypothetical protein
MPPFRIRIRTLLLVIGLSAVALAAWKLIPPWWQEQQAIRKLVG